MEEFFLVVAVMHGGPGRVRRDFHETDDPNGDRFVFAL